MFFIWIGITIEVMYDVYRISAKGFIFLMNKARSQHKVEDAEDDGDDASSVSSEPVVTSGPVVTAKPMVSSDKKKKEKGQKKME